METALDSLKECLTCAVCHEDFSGRDPRSLPCLHVFCLSCIERTFNSRCSGLRDDEFRCPTCKNVSTIPQKCVNNFPKFFLANTMHEICQYISRKAKSSHQKCTVCSDDQCEVEGFCFTCTRLFCHQCFLPHTQTEYYADHVHVQVTKDNIQCLVCTEHDQFVETYCVDCEKSVCGQCLLTIHKRHNVKDFTIGKVPYLDVLREIREKLSTSKENRKKIHKMQNAFNVNIHVVKDQISKHTQMLIDQITQQNDTLIDQLEMHQTITNIGLRKMKTHTKITENLITKVEQRVMEKTQPIPELPGVHPKDLDSITADLRHQLPVVFEKNNITMYQFNPETLESLGSLSELNQSLQMVPRPVHGRVHPQRLSCPTSVTARTKSAKLFRDIDAGEPIFDVSWTMKGKLLFLLGDHIKIYDRKGTTKSYPFDAFDVKGTIHTVAGHPTLPALVIAAEHEDDTTIYWMRLGSVQSTFTVCRLPVVCFQLTFTQDRDLLVCTENRIYKYQTDGTKIWERETKHLAWYTTVLPDDACLISGKKKMSLIDKDGQWISFFPLDLHILRTPRGVCADSKGHVYVADYRKKAVLMFTSDGRSICELLSFDKTPEYLALFQDKYLCVSCGKHEESSILIYSLK